MDGSVFVTHVPQVSMTVVATSDTRTVMCRSKVSQLVDSTDLNCAGVPNSGSTAQTCATASP